MRRRRRRKTKSNGSSFLFSQAILHTVLWPPQHDRPTTWFSVKSVLQSNYLELYVSVECGLLGRYSWDGQKEREGARDHRHLQFTGGSKRWMTTSTRSSTLWFYLFFIVSYSVLLFDSWAVFELPGREREKILFQEVSDLCLWSPSQLDTMGF